MANINEIFSRINKNKAELKDLKRIYRDALENSKPHKETTEELKKMREKKKSLEQTIQADFKSELARLDQLKAELADDQVLLSDAALTQLLKGEEIKIIDKDDISYEPVFSIKFKRAK